MRVRQSLGEMAQLGHFTQKSGANDPSQTRGRKKYHADILITSLYYLLNLVFHWVGTLFAISEVNATRKRRDMDPFETLKTKKTLLVDDDRLIRDSLGMAFSSRGCTIRTVESAEKGIEAMALEHFDIIVSDFKLPGMNGMEFFRTRGASHQGCIHVLISGNVQADELEDKDNLGIDEFVEKPFTVLGLADTLAGLIANGENG